MKVKKLISGLTIIAIFQTINVCAQQKPLQIGDKMPDINIPALFNYTGKSARISDFKGKLLILDFWGTWCAPCVANIPKMDSLQRKFKGKIQFLPITDEPLERVTSFAEHFFNAKKIEIMTVYKDMTLKKLFDYGSLPFYVWIDSTGTIIAKTFSEELTAANIEKALQNKLNGIKNRTDKGSLVIDRHEPVFNLHFNQILDDKSTQQHVISKENITGLSVGTSYIPGLPVGQSTNDTTHYFATNISIARMYAHLYSLMYYGYINLGIQSEGRTVYDIKNSEKLAKLKSDTKGDEYLNFLEKNSGCYEIIWPKTIVFNDYQTKFKLVKADLDRYFGIPLGIDASIEKREVKQCMVLEKIGSTEALKTNGEKPREDYDRYNYKIQNLSFRTFFSRLSGYYLQLTDMPVLDKSGIHENIDLELKCNMTDIKELNQALKKYGLMFTTKAAVADVLVFKER
jgi:thiol-disulfide isomerase/thioredoxin